MKNIILTTLVLTFTFLPAASYAAASSPCNPEAWSCKGQDGKDMSKDILRSYFEDPSGKQYGKVCFPGAAQAGADPSPSGSPSSSPSSDTQGAAQGQEKQSYDEVKSACDTMKGQLAKGGGA